jgi:hypothetical protein
LSICRFFSEFFELKNIIFDLFEKQDHCCTKSLSNQFAFPNFISYSINASACDPAASKGKKKNPLSVSCISTLPNSTDFSGKRSPILFVLANASAPPWI